MEDHPAKSYGWSFALVGRGLVGPSGRNDHVERLGQFVSRYGHTIELELDEDRLVHELPKRWSSLPVQLLRLVKQVECQSEHLAPGLQLRIKSLDVPPDTCALIADGYELLPDLLLWQVAVGGQIKQVALPGIEGCKPRVQSLPYPLRTAQVMGQGLIELAPDCQPEGFREGHRAVVVENRLLYRVDVEIRLVTQTFPTSHAEEVEVLPSVAPSRR